MTSVRGLEAELNHMRLIESLAPGDIIPLAQSIRALAKIILDLEARLVAIERELS